MSDENNVKKTIPSKLETGFQHFLYKHVGPHIPKKMTPNQMTMMGAVGGLIGIIFAFLARFGRFFLIGTIFGLVCHIVCDDLDGFIARSRKMTSMEGAYLDLLTDILHITYLVIALTFSGFVSFQLSIFMVPVYALIIFTAMNYIRYLNEFLFPRMGPIETHLFFIVVCVGSMIFGFKPLFYIGKFGVHFADILFAVGGLPMYFEMIRLQIQLLKKLREKDRDNE